MIYSHTCKTTGKTSAAVNLVFIRGCVCLLLAPGKSTEDDMVLSYDDGGNQHSPIPMENGIIWYIHHFRYFKPCCVGIPAGVVTYYFLLCHECYGVQPVEAPLTVCRAVLLQLALSQTPVEPRVSFLPA